MLVKVLKSLARNGLHACINVTGLALALTACIVLGLYLRDELTYDQHNLRHKSIYRVETEFVSRGNPERIASASALLAPMLATDIPEIEAFTRFGTLGWWEWGTDRLIRHGDDAFYWSNLYLADSNVFEMFTHEILHGDPATALDDPSAVAVSESFAQRYFGDADPLGEVITLDDGKAYNITLVFADLPRNSHLRYDLLFSFNSVPPVEDPQQRAADLFSGGVFTFLQLPPTFDVESFPAMAQDFYMRHMAARGREINIDSWSAWLRPLDEVHLYADVSTDLPTGNPEYLLGLMAAGGFLLLVAVINYVNLATAAATQRARQIGTRKILGASRRSLALQCFGEAIVLTLLALLVSLLVIELVLPFTPVAEWLGNADLLDKARAPAVLALAAGFSVLVGLLSGLYPALYLVSLPPLEAMGRTGTGGGFAWLRKAMVLLQFAVTTCVIACVLTMTTQLRYLADRPLGFADEGRLMVTLRGTDVLQSMETIKTELLKSEQIMSVSSSDAMLSLELPAGLMDVETNDGDISLMMVRHLPVSDDFVDVMGMEIVAGRNISADIATDAREAFVVNEALVREMGWEQPIGKLMGPARRKVVGVVRDFNFSSLHSPVEPLVMYQGITNFTNMLPELKPFKQQFLALRIDTDRLAETLDFIGATLRRFDPVHPLDYRFVDDALSASYDDERRLTKLIGVFAGICIFVACFGLYGLASYTATRRTKEVGMRKVLGSSVWEIVVLLTNDFSRLALLSNLIAWPLAYVVMGKWLENFAYRIDLTPLVFIGSGLIALCIAWVTVGGTAAKAASMKPVLALRYE